MVEIEQHLYAKTLLMTPHLKDIHPENALMSYNMKVYLKAVERIQVKDPKVYPLHKVFPIK